MVRRMIQATQALREADVGADGDVRPASVRSRAEPALGRRSGFRISVHEDLAAIEKEWRAFEQSADCTVFQCFDWLSAWLRHVGMPRGVRPAVVAVRDEAGAMHCLLPLMVEPRGLARRLTFLGSDLCDYNVPLLAPDFPACVGADRFVDLWHDIGAELQRHPGLRFDVICFEKMPERVGNQDNPMLRLPAGLNPNGAYWTPLGDDWESFYTAKRSSSTRRRDRTKRKRLTDFGEVRFVNPQSATEIAASFETMIEQKSRALIRMGADDVFARPGYRAFFREIASRPIAHLSRLDIGPECAAANLGLIFRGRYYHVIASLGDGEASKFGPGIAHLHELMRYAIEHKCDAFDFTIGDERYKSEWCDGVFRLYDHVAAATWRGVPAAARIAARRGLKRWIKQTPAVWKAASRVREFLGKLRR
jgi:CelD/BcsL family acetyltransferase involved in cellulose biosynthesis